MIKRLNWLLLHQHSALLSLIGASLFLLFPSQMSNLAVTEEWDQSILYGSLFNWASIQTAFLFGIYTFIMGRPEVFVKRFKTTKLYRRSMLYLRKTVFISLLLSAVCVPLMLASPDIELWSWSEKSLPNIGYAVFAVISVFGLLVLGRVIICMRYFMFIETQTDLDSSKGK